MFKLARMRCNSSCSFRARVKLCLLTTAVNVRCKRYSISRLLVDELLTELVYIFCSNTYLYLFIIIVESIRWNLMWNDFFRVFILCSLFLSFTIFVSLPPFILSPVFISPPF
jgi:hypothetical protein